MPDAHDRVRVIPNFVDTERIRPADPDENAYRASTGSTGQAVVMYAGNVGFSQSLDLRGRRGRARLGTTAPTWCSSINGGGSARAEPRASRPRASPTCASSTSSPRSGCPRCWPPADIHVVPLERGLARSSVPSKLYSILAAGRPVVASVDAGTEVARVVERAGAGLAVPPDDPEAFTKALATLLDDPDAAAAMGAPGGRSSRAGRRRRPSPSATRRCSSELGAVAVPGG